MRTDKDSRVGIIPKTILPLHLSPYLTNCVEPAKCGCQLVPILRLSLDLDRVQQIVLWRCVYMCKYYCCRDRGKILVYEKNNYIDKTEKCGCCGDVCTRREN